MKTTFAILALLAFSLLAFRPAPATADEMACPGTGMNTVQGLNMCVQHAISTGAITDPGVANSLLAELAAAQSAVDRGQPTVAANILRAFISEVQAQSGVHIEVAHAQHMVMHAQQVITALQ